MSNCSCTPFMTEFYRWCERYIPLYWNTGLSTDQNISNMCDILNRLICFDKQLCAAWKDFEEKFDANIEDTVREILNQWVIDGTLTDIITQVLQSVVNVVLLGVDNTGNKDVGDLITNILNEYTGRRIYFPAGTYKINSTVFMRTDGDYKGNILVCDSSAKFFTDGITTMFSLGNGNEASTLERFGFIGAYIDATNVTECAIFVNNHQHSFYCDGLTMRNCGNIQALKIGTDNLTSSQAYINNVNITGNGSVRGDGIVIFNTDNFFNNITVGRFKRNFVLGGGGNLISNLHTWNYGDEFNKLGISSPDEKLNYPSITVNGANNFSNIQIDNGSPGILLTNNAIQNRFNNVAFNFEENFPWAKQTDLACCTRVAGYNQTLGNTFEFDGVSFLPKVGQYIRLLSFNRYDRMTTYPFGVYWKMPFIATRENKLRCMECDFGRTIYEKTPCLTTNLNIADVSKVTLVGYIGMNISTMQSIYTFYGTEKGEVKCRITNNNGTITVESEIIEPFAVNTSVFIGNTTEVVNGFTVVPVYFQSHTSGSIYTSLIVEPTKPLDVFNSFVPFKLPEWIDKPDGLIEVKLYE